MAIPRQLLRHVNWFNSTDSFWSFTKARAVREDIVGEIVGYHRVLREFVRSEEVWEPGSQQRFANEVQPGTNAAWARELKMLFNQLGSAWINNRDRVEFTDVGREILQSPTPGKLIERQVQKYQMGNPQTSPRLTSSISVVPHYVLLEFLIESHPMPMTKDEFILFVMKIHKHGDIPRYISLMEDYRRLSSDDRGKIRSRLNAGGNYGKFDRAYSYAASFLAFPRYLSYANSRLSIADLASAERALSWYRRGNNTHIKFKSQKDWFSHYGGLDSAPNPIAAADYYRHVGEPERATGAYREAMQKGMTQPNDTLEDYRCRVYGEAAMESWLVNNLERIERGLTLVQSQYETSAAGRIDILARDARDNFVVVELKRDKASDAALGQLLRYLGWVRLSLSETDLVRGFVIGEDVDPHMEYAILAHDVLDDLCKLKRFSDLGARLRTRRTKHKCRAWVEDLAAR